MRDPYVDIIKGFGIFTVVTLHSTIFVQEINYFNLQLFFFVSGFLLNPNKCVDFGNFFLRKLKTLWKPFVMYNVLFFILHDFFLYINWIITEPMPQSLTLDVQMVAPYIDLISFFHCVANNIFLGQVAPMCGATWFMAPFTINILLFAFLVHISNGKAKFLLPLLTLGFFIVGTEIVKHKPGLVLYADMAMMLLPLTLAGFYTKKICNRKNILLSDLITTYKMPSAIGLIVSVAVFAYLEINEVIIYLPRYGIGHWFIFTLAAFAGLCISMFMAKIVLMIEPLKKFFTLIGEESFHIMSLHFLGFKILNTIIVLLYDLDSRFMSAYTINGAPKFYYVLYIFFGIGTSLLLRKIYKKFFEGRIFNET